VHICTTWTLAMLAPACPRAGVLTAPAAALSARRALAGYAPRGGLHAASPRPPKAASQRPARASAEMDQDGMTCASDARCMRRRLGQRRASDDRAPCDDAQPAGSRNPVCAQMRAPRCPAYARRSGSSTR
jgi:hypothetical protein